MVHEFGAIVYGLELHVVRKCRLDLFQFTLESSRYIMAVLTHEHETESQYGLTLTARRDCTSANFLTDLHVGHVAHANRHAGVCSDYDRSDLVQVRRAPDPVNEQHFAAASNATATHVAVVCFDGLHYFIERQAVFDKTVWVNTDLVLLFVPAPAIHLCNASDRSQLRLDHPIVNRAQLGKLANTLLLRDSCQVIASARHEVVKHFAQARGNGPQRRMIDPSRQLHRAETLVDYLSRKVDVRPVLKGHNDLRQPEFGNRTDLVETRQATDYLFNRKCNLLLDLFRPK